jgi:hypothetical protein
MRANDLLSVAKALSSRAWILFQCNAHTRGAIIMIRILLLGLVLIAAADG